MILLLTGGDWLIAFGAILSGIGGFLVGLAALRMAQTGKKQLTPQQREAPHEAPEHSDPGDDGGPGPSSA